MMTLTGFYLLGRTQKGYEQGISVRALLQQYNIESLREYQHRSRAAINMQRQSAAAHPTLFKRNNTAGVSMPLLSFSSLVDHPSSKLRFCFLCSDSRVVFRVCGPALLLPPPPPLLLLLRQRYCTRESSRSSASTTPQTPSKPPATAATPLASPSSPIPTPLFLSHSLQQQQQGVVMTVGGAAAAAMGCRMCCTRIHGRPSTQHRRR